MTETPAQQESFLETLSKGLSCTCPRCHEGALYKPGFVNFELDDTCKKCGLDFGENDSADGPAVFLMFVLGFTIVPMALILEMTLHPPLWLHAVLWSFVVIGLTMGSLKPLKSYIITLQYKHRPGDWS